MSQFPQMSKCHQKVRTHPWSGSLSLNEEVPGSANESCCMATQSINVIIGVPWGPIQDGESS